MTDDSAFKKQVRARMAETGENYTVARRAVIAVRDPGQPPVALRVHLNPYVDLELTTEEARAFEAADEQGRRDMANRLLADHIELAGAREAGVAAGPGQSKRAEPNRPQQPPALRSSRSRSCVSRRSLPRYTGGYQQRPESTRSGSAGTWTTSGLMSTPPGRAWRSAMAVRKSTGSATSWRS